MNWNKCEKWREKPIIFYVRHRRRRGRRRRLPFLYLYIIPSHTRECAQGGKKIFLKFLFNYFLFCLHSHRFVHFSIFIDREDRTFARTCHAKFFSFFPTLSIYSYNIRNKQQIHANSQPITRRFVSYPLNWKWDDLIAKLKRHLVFPNSTLCVSV